MQILPSYLRDTKYTLQLIEEKNEEGIPKNTNFWPTDIKQMYPDVPMRICELKNTWQPNQTQTKKKFEI